MPNKLVGMKKKEMKEKEQPVVY